MSEFRKVTSKELIIKHGIKEFLERGFKSASLRSIVKKAGLTTGAFYNYYSSKEELFNELVFVILYPFLIYYICLSSSERKYVLEKLSMITIKK